MNNRTSGYMPKSRIEKTASDKEENNFAKGGGVEGEMYKKFGEENSKLVNFDIDDLDMLETQHYNHFIKSMSKAEVLQVLINNVESDYSQLSDKLSEIAEEQYPSDEWYEDNKDTFAKGGGVRTHNGREYAIGRNWTNDHRHHNKSEDYEIPMNNRKDKYEDGGEEDTFAKGGGVRTHNGREYAIGRNWTNDHRHHNKSEDYEIPMNNRKGKYADGGDVFAKGGSNDKIFYTLGFSDIPTMYGVYQEWIDEKLKSMDVPVSNKTRLKLTNALHDRFVSDWENGVLGFSPDKKRAVFLEWDEDAQEGLEEQDADGNWVAKKGSKYISFTNKEWQNYFESISDDEDVFAKGGGVRTHNGREYAIGRNWTNDHRHHNKSEDYEIPMNKRKGKYEDGGSVDSETQAKIDKIEKFINNPENQKNDPATVEKFRSILASIKPKASAPATPKVEPKATAPKKPIAPAKPRVTATATPKATMTKKAEPQAKTSKGVKVTGSSSVTVDGEEMDMNSKEFCDYLLKQFRDRREKSKNAPKKKTASVMAKITANVEKSVLQAIKSSVASNKKEIEKNPNFFVKKVEKLESSTKSFLQSMKDVLGDDFKEGEIASTMKSIEELTESLIAKYKTK